MSEEKKCAQCGGEHQLGLVALPIAKTTESGQIFFANENAKMALQMTVRLCPYCTILAEEGFIIMVERDGKTELFCPNILRQLENISDKEIKDAVKKGDQERRRLRQKINKNSAMELGKVVLKARKFARGVL